MPYMPASLPYRPPPIAHFLPSSLTQQTQNDIFAQGAQKFAPQRLLGKSVVDRGVDPTSNMSRAKVARISAAGRNQQALGAAQTGLQDELSRYQFGASHALAANQDVTQGARNQAMRDAIWQHGRQNQQNLLLSLLGNFGSFF